MSNPFDFGDDSVPCEHCTASFPKADLISITRVGRTAVAGGVLRDESRMFVCPACRTLLLDRTARQLFRERAGKILIWAVLIGLSALAAGFAVLSLSRLR